MINKGDISLVEIARQEGVELKSRGAYHKGRCPFHDDSDPSFAIYEDKRFKCFGCGAGGDVIDFIMKKRELTFPQAMNYLGLDMEERERPDRPYIKPKTMIDIIAEEEERGINVKDKYGSEFIDHLLISEIKRGASVMSNETMERIKELCQKGNVEYVGIGDYGGRHLVYFNDKDTGSTLSIWYEDGFCLGAILSKVNTSRQKYSAEDEPCNRCYHRKYNPDKGWCYMFKNKEINCRRYTLLGFLEPHDKGEKCYCKKCKQRRGTGQ